MVCTLERNSQNNIFLKQKSSSVVGAGEGVFLLRDAPENRVVSLYSGFLYDYPVEARLYQSNLVENTSRTDEYRRACKKYSLGLSTYHTTIDIPPEFDLPGIFQPTFGPKVSFIYFSCSKGSLKLKLKLTFFLKGVSANEDYQNYYSTSRKLLNMSYFMLKKLFFRNISNV